MWDSEFAWSILPKLLRGLLVTIEATALGMTMALVVGLLWALCRRARNRMLAWPVAALVEFVRSTPLLAQLFFLFYGLPALGIVIGPLTTGVFALGLHYSCYTSEVYRAGIDGVDRGQWEGARVLGFGRWQTYRHVVLPQALPPILPALGNYLIAMFKDTPLLSAITVLEVLQSAKIIGKESFRYLEPLTIVGGMYLLLSIASGLLVQKLEKYASAQRS